MANTLLITGASSGIGACCVKLADQKGINVIATARSEKKLLSLKVAYPKIQIIVADIATQIGRKLIVNGVNIPINHLLFNAARLDVPEHFEAMGIEDFQNFMATNVEPIVFLTQQLMLKEKFALENRRILSVSSGAAIQAIAGLGHYCISKAAALMATDYLKVELNKQGVLVNNYFPGVVDTAMQKKLRSSNTQIFPYSDEFKKLKADSNLNQPKDVAHDIINCFTELDGDEFIQKDLAFKKKG
jgi:benzil reductase ((S)-benzoin forming)